MKKFFILTVLLFAQINTQITRIILSNDKELEKITDEYTLFYQTNYDERKRGLLINRDIELAENKIEQKFKRTLKLHNRIFVAVYVYNPLIRRSNIGNIPTCYFYFIDEWKDTYKILRLYCYTNIVIDWYHDNENLTCCKKFIRYFFNPN